MTLKENKGVLGWLLLPAGLLGAHALLADLPLRAHHGQTVTHTTPAPQPCGQVSALTSQRAPVRESQDGSWNFARMGGLTLHACGAGTLRFTASRRAVDNTPSRWEVYLDSRLLSSGEVSGDSQAQQVQVPRSGSLSLVFTNAYADPDDVDNRRTLYFSAVQLIPGQD